MAVTSWGILSIGEPKRSGICLENAALAVSDVRAVYRRVAQAAKKENVTEWSRPPSHVLPLRRSHIQVLRVAQATKRWAIVADG
uniref:Uncharacterized protein n=1 Tax=Peronospora matthiolae TaxID=2874970 RepID=A0AAV1VC72_9STRA